MRFGLVGTGHWARQTHAAALTAAADAELVGVWGRNAERTAALAGDVGAAAYDDVDRMLADVDAVAFAVPPDVQAELAVRAARAGRHLLLEKPIATTVGYADRLVDAVDEAGVSSVVFFTGRFEPAQRKWLASVAESSWDGASALWISAAFGPGSPYTESPWRREKGALWDVGPHLLAMLTPALGPVTRVSADAGRGDLVHLVLHHESGASSTASLTLGAPVEASRVELTLWGASGRSAMPAGGVPAEVALRTAVQELVRNARAGVASHPCDVRFGRYVVGVLADAERQLA